MAEFKKKALETLDDIFNLVESEFENYEVDYEDENLRIDSLEGGGTFIISIHSPTSQIWLSSPISGAHHFERKSTDSVEWVSTRDANINLKQLIVKELRAE
tara:strand:- start:334 stop:636 length:303 start_codon:yes stop_codon:yes gene_type:complete